MPFFYLQKFIAEKGMWVPRDRCVVELQSFLEQRYSSAQRCHGLLDPLNALEGTMSLQI